MAGGLRSSASSVTPRAFGTQTAFRSWLAKNHATERELHLRLFKVHASHRGIGYREALDEALCWGWIDGVRRALDADSFTQRFSPRKPKSFWSDVNVKRYRELLAEGRVATPGKAAFRPEHTPRLHRSIKVDPGLSPDLLMRFKANAVAWKFFSTRPPSYQRSCRRMIMGAVRQETRERRLRTLVDLCARGRLLPMFDRSRA